MCMDNFLFYCSEHSRIPRSKLFDGCLDQNYYFFYSSIIKTHLIFFTQSVEKFQSDQELYFLYC